MILTNKQKDEVNFLVSFAEIPRPSDVEVEEYMLLTTKGIGSGQSKFNSNPLFQAKRKFDISLKMWRKGISDGYISLDELIEDFPSEYFKKSMKTLMSTIKQDIKSNPNIEGFSMVLFSSLVTASKL